MKLLISLLLAVSLYASASTNPTATVNGVVDDRQPIYAFTNATIYIDAKTIIKDGTLLIQNSKVLNVGQNLTLPKNAIVKNLNQAYIYPGFILMDSDYGLSELPEKPKFSFSGPEVLNTTLKGALNGNEAIKASYHAVRDFHQNKEKAKELRNLGFTTVLSHKHDGIMRGTSALFSLNDQSDQLSVVKNQAAFHLSFSKGTSKQNYPFSLMGASALIRQTWMDSQWYKNNDLDFTDLDLQAVADSDHLPQIFESNNWQQTLLAKKIANEFDKSIVVKTSGDEYKHIDAIKNLESSLIVPLNFPKALDVADELDAWNISLEKMMEWETAPFNPYLLHINQIPFSLIPKAKGEKTFHNDLLKSIEHGLPKTAALASLTSTPAKTLNVKNIGHLRKGAQANFLISDGDLFTKDGRLAETWVDGNRFVINELPKIIQGVYEFKIGDNIESLNVKNNSGKFKVSNSDEDIKANYKLVLDGNFVNLTIENDKKEQTYLGYLSDKGASNINGQKPIWSLNRVSDIDLDSDKQEKKAEDKSVPQIPQPFSSYGLFQPQSTQSSLITNTTVWTNENQGVLEETDVLIIDGKISEIGKNLKADVDLVIDGTGQHLTAGIIDEHSHIALLSVNDIAVNSSMVRMEDAIDSDDVDIYRNLAGGVTAAQLLHGSANPIGGQSALVKMRWGATSDEMLIEDAEPFIKFALGENVKRSRSAQSIRYPLTRMGVEQVFRDAFTQAKEYEAKWNKYNKLSKRAKKKAKAPRRDLMLEATLEIVNKDRFVSCHSYVQSEINMLMKVAEDFDFNINTFTHILEGYKVADKMKAHGAGGSTFADWWSYKWEVNYAIPYNAAIMTKLGVTTAINSDDSEMSRRLNQEAAKSIKYGGLSEEEALKMVTLNPAKLLHLDDRMGSIKSGKDADIVLWSDNPLSIYAKANKTFVDGRLLYDRDKNSSNEMLIEKQRRRLIEKMKSSDGAKSPASMTPKKNMQCESLSGYEYLTGVQK